MLNLLFIKTFENRHGPCVRLPVPREKRPNTTPTLTREEIEKQMHELARKYVETHDREIIKELYALVRKLETVEKE